MLEHGGRLRRAAADYGIALTDWIDLSTGLAPYAWPIVTVPATAWARLPEDDDGLELAAQRYYGAPAVLPVAGSQAAIQVLPTLFAGVRVGIVEPCYTEHRLAWERSGCRPLGLQLNEVEDTLAVLDVLVVVNPNNPTGATVAPQRLLRWQATLAARGGCLIVDEAFCDLHPELSLAGVSDRPGLVVLRSLGKFFGLAGARLGFVLAERRLLDALREALGPWPVSGPSRWIGAAALADQAEQARWRLRIARDGQRLEALLQAQRLAPAGNGGLFVWVPCDRAESLYLHLARRGILVRWFTERSALRFGLPGSEACWRRLEQGLADFNEGCAWPR